MVEERWRAFGTSTRSCPVMRSHATGLPVILPSLSFSCTSQASNRSGPQYAPVSPAATLRSAWNVFPVRRSQCAALAVVRAPPRAHASAPLAAAPAHRCSSGRRAQSIFSASGAPAETTPAARACRRAPAVSCGKNVRAPPVTAPRRPPLRSQQQAGPTLSVSCIDAADTAMLRARVCISQARSMGSLTSRPRSFLLEFFVWPCHVYFRSNKKVCTCIAGRASALCGAAVCVRQRGRAAPRFGEPAVPASVSGEREGCLRR